MNNAVRPKLRRQIHPDVIAILERHDPDNLLPAIDAPNYDDVGCPLWLGPTPAFWESLVGNRDDLDEFVALLRVHYPSFCAVLVRIRAKRLGRVIPFFFNRGQVRFWNVIQSRVAALLSLFIVILKARQFGISTFVLAWDYWHVWRLEDQAAVVIGDTDVLVKEFLDRIAVIHDELPDLDFFKPELRAQNRKARVPKTQLEYVDRRTKILTMVDKQVKVGLVGNHFLLSELAKYNDPAQLIEDLLPMLPPRGTPARLQCSVFVESTPRGKNAFYDLWQQAKAGESEWVAFFLPWFVLEDEYSVEPPPGWKPDAALREFWRRCTHERRKLEGRDVTLAQIYWYACELADADFDQDKMDRQYPTDDETCFLIGNDSVFRRQIRYVKASVQDAEEQCAAMWKLRNVTLPRTKRGGPTCWRGEILRSDPNDPRIEIPVPDPYTREPPARFVPLFMPMLGADGRKIEGPNGNRGRLTTWAPPLPGHLYVAGIDSSAGVGVDRAVISFIDVLEGLQVAEFADAECPPEYLADQAVAIGYWYNTAVMMPELNSYGSVVMKRMKNVWRYPKVGLEEKWDEPGLKKNKFGIYVSEDMKRVMVSNLRWMLQERYLRISSDACLSELSTYERVTGDDGEESFGCDPPAHDDRVAGIYLAAITIKQSPRLAGFIKPRRAQPSAAMLGLNDTTDEDEPISAAALESNDPRMIATRKLPKVLQAILDGDQKVAMKADPFEPLGGF